MSNIDSPISTCPLKEKEEKQAVQDPIKHWIKFKTIDNNGIPVGNVTIQVTLPDGREEEWTSDENGLIEIRNIDPPGNCIIKSDWKEVNVLESVLIQ